MAAGREPGDVRLLALRNHPREYIIVDDTKNPLEISKAMDWLRDAGGGTMYKLEYYEDKYQHVVPRCERLGVV